MLIRLSVTDLKNKLTKSQDRHILSEKFILAISGH